MLTQLATFSEGGTETAAENTLLKDPAGDLDSEMRQERNDETASSEAATAGDTGARQTEQTVAPLFVRPEFTVEVSDFRLLQLWEGRVDQVGAEELVATIFDRTRPESAPEQVSISIEDINPEDRDLLRPGAVFYWSIGYANYVKGPRQRTSRIRFRRLVISKRRMAEAKNAAKQFADLFARDTA